MKNMDRKKTVCDTAVKFCWEDIIVGVRGQARLNRKILLTWNKVKQRSPISVCVCSDQLNPVKNICLAFQCHRCLCVCVGRIHTLLSLISHVCNKENVEFTQNSANFPSVGHQRLVLSDQCGSWILSIRKSTFIREICLRPSVDWLFVTVFEKSWHKIYCKCQKRSNRFKTSRHWMIREESFR